MNANAIVQSPAARIAAPVLLGVLMLLAWQLLVRALNVPEYLVPAPTDIARTLREAVERRPEAHALAHLGAVDAALAGARWTLEGAARDLDESPDDRRAAQLRTMRVRAVAEQAVTTTVDHVGRALGATPLCLDGDHAAAVADVTVYVRQSHAAGFVAHLVKPVLADTLDEAIGRATSPARDGLAAARPVDGRAPALGLLAGTAGPNHDDPQTPHPLAGSRAIVPALRGPSGA